LLAQDLVAALVGPQGAARVSGRGVRADQDLPRGLAQAVELEDEFRAADGRGGQTAPYCETGVGNPFQVAA